jgi:hypothetical protein
MTERWLRWYDGTVRDGKFRIVAELSEVPVCTVVGVWASLLEDASTNTTRGIAAKGVNFHSLWLGIAEHEVGTVWNGMERVELIKRNGDEIVILNWSKRQFETDGKDPTSKERKSRWKQRHKPSGTVRNAQERLGTPETETETETDIRKKDSRAAAAAGSTNDDFEKFKSEYPKRKGSQGWPVARKKFDTLVASGVLAATLIEAARRFRLAEQDKIGTPYVSMASTWMHQERWREFVGAAEQPMNAAATELFRKTAEFKHQRELERANGADNSEELLCEGATVHEFPRNREVSSN